jgi:ADP-ribosyl-[dinitrogen reductase] hydrolase
MSDKLNSTTGSLIGLAIGDALGAPYEFKIPPYDVANDYVRGGAHNVDIGEWTDDTSMALCLAQSLIDNNCFNAKDQMDKYLAWYEEGYFSTRSTCFDIGNTVATALMHYKMSKDPYSGIKGDKNSGNGSLMRLAPIALKYHDDKEKLIEYAAKSSQTTHQSELAIDACIFYAQLIAGAMQGDSKEKLLSKNYIDTTTLREELSAIAKGSYKESRVYKPTGYVIATLETALHAFYRFDTFEEGLIHVIGLGYDTDTVGAVYGQLAGAYYGYDAIPHRWRSQLMQHDRIYTMAQEVAALAVLSKPASKEGED